MDSILFYLVIQEDLEKPVVKEFKTLKALSDFATVNNFNKQNIKLIASNVYFYTPELDGHVVIKYRDKVKKRKESGENIK